MTKEKFPYIALWLGLFLMLVVFKGSDLGSDGKTLIPLLTLLLVCEFGAVVTAIGSYLGGRQIVTSKCKLVYYLVTASCVLLSIQFLVRGFQLWPN